MYVTNDKPTVYFDVDSTLVFTQQENPSDNAQSHNIVWIGNREFFIHQPHVQAILDFAARGHNVIVWSQGGAAWAESVVRELALTRYVQACLSKPSWIFDDKPSRDWLPEGARSYMDPCPEEKA